MNKEAVNAIGLWLFRIALLASALYCEFHGHDNAALVLGLGLAGTFYDD